MNELGQSRLPPSNAEAVGDVGAVVAEVLLDDVDVKGADGGGLPVEGLAGGAGEGVDGGGDVGALEVVEAGVGVEDDARQLLVAQVARGQRGQVREPVLEDVEGPLARDPVAGLRGPEHEPAGAARRRRRDRDVVQRRRLVVAAAERVRSHVLVVLVRPDVVDLQDAGDRVPRGGGRGATERVADRRLRAAVVYFILMDGFGDV